MNGVYIESDIKAKLYRTIRKCGIPLIFYDSLALVNQNSDNDEIDIEIFNQDHNLDERSLSDLKKFYLNEKSYVFLDIYLYLSKIVLKTWNRDNRNNGLRIFPILKIVANKLQSQTINSPIHDFIHLNLYNFFDDRLLIGHLRKGRRISERSVVKWSWQLLTSINFCHQSYICYCMAINDIHLTSDFAVLKEIRKALGHKSGVTNDPPLRTLSDAWISPHRITHSIINNRSSNIEQNIKMFASLSAFEGNDQKCYVPSNHPHLEDVKREYAEFSRQLQLNYRHLGLVIAQLLLKQSLPTSELDHYCRNSFCFEDFHKIFNTKKLPKALKDLITLCFNSTTDYREIQCTETGMTVLSAASRALAISIQKDLGNLFTEMGGEVISFEPPLYWTSADEERRRKGLLDRRLQLQRKAETGRLDAKRRLLRHKFQVEYDLLPEEKQRRIAARREARQTSRRNSRRRKAAINCASFRHWDEDHFQRWVCDAIHSSLINSKKLLLHRSDGRKGDKLVFQRAEDFLAPVATVQPNLLKKFTKVIYANLKQFPTAAELEIDQTNSFRSYAKQLSGVVVRRMAAKDAERRMTSIQSEIRDKMQGNALTRVLPPATYNILRERSEAEVYSSSRVIHNIAFELGQDLGHSGDDQWMAAVSRSLAAAMLLKFDLDKEQRDLGVHCASSRLQAFCRQIIVRRKVKEIWRRVDTILKCEGETDSSGSGDEQDAETEAEGGAINGNIDQQQDDINKDPPNNIDNQFTVVKSDRDSKGEGGKGGLLPAAFSAVTPQLLPLSVSRGRHGAIKITVLSGVWLRRRRQRSGSTSASSSDITLNGLKGEMLTLPDRNTDTSTDSSLLSIHSYIETNFSSSDSKKFNSLFSSTSPYSGNYASCSSKVSMETSYHHLLKLVDDNYDDEKQISASTPPASFPVRVIISKPGEISNGNVKRTTTAGIVAIDRKDRKSVFTVSSSPLPPKFRESVDSVSTSHSVLPNPFGPQASSSSSSSSTSASNSEVSTTILPAVTLPQRIGGNDSNGGRSVIPGTHPQEPESPKECSLHITVDRLPAASHHVIHIVCESKVLSQAEGVQGSQGESVDDNVDPIVYIGSVSVVTPPAPPSPPLLLPLQIFRYTRSTHEKNAKNLSQTKSQTTNILHAASVSSPLPLPLLAPLATKRSQSRLESVVKPQVEQVAAIRVQWTTAASRNGSGDSLFEVQRRLHHSSRGEWGVLVTTESCVYSDIVQWCESIRWVEYRVRVKTGSAWSAFSSSLAASFPLVRRPSSSDAAEDSDATDNAITDTDNQRCFAQSFLPLTTKSPYKIPFLQSDSLLDLILQSDSSIQFGRFPIQNTTECVDGEIGTETEIETETDGKSVIIGEVGTAEGRPVDNTPGIRGIGDWLHCLSEACPIEVTAAKDQRDKDIGDSMKKYSFSQTNRFLKESQKTVVTAKLPKNRNKSKLGSSGETLFLPSVIPSVTSYSSEKERHSLYENIDDKNFRL